MIPSFNRRPIQSATRADIARGVADLQERLERTLRPLVDNQSLDSVAVTATEISTAAAGTKLVHGLERTPQGWFVTDLNADANLWRLSWDKNSITLRASAAVTVAIRVY